MMAYHTLILKENDRPIDQHLLDKHYLRKHGKNAYYGQ
jgi:L-ribulose-5-phosphate 4-epimerase